MWNFWDSTNTNLQAYKGIEAEADPKPEGQYSTEQLLEIKLPLFWERNLSPLMYNPRPSS